MGRFRPCLPVHARTNFAKKRPLDGPTYRRSCLAVIGINPISWASLSGGAWLDGEGNSLVSPGARSLATSLTGGVLRGSSRRDCSD